MARYDILEAGFNSLDETINFGTRAVADNTSLYEIVTVAVIRSSEPQKLTDQLKILSQYQHERIFFNINNILRIIKDQNMSDEIGSFEFDCIIDTFCVSSCERFILIGTQDGKITLRSLSCSDDKNNIGCEFPIVFEEKLEDCNFNGSYFKGSFFDDAFYVITYNGLVKKILLDQDKSQNDLKSEIIFNFETNINICAFKYPYICVEGDKLSLLNINKRTCQSTKAIGLKNMQALQLKKIGSNTQKSKQNSSSSANNIAMQANRYFFGYDITGNIYRIYTNELIIFCLNERIPCCLANCFEDLLLLKDENEGTVHIIGITNGLTQKRQEIQLMTWPELDVVYSIPLEGPVHLMNIKDLTKDVLFFTEIRENNILSEIRLQVVIKADPEFRVAKLVQKQLFDEAEIFARTFNVSPQIITQGKAQNISSKMICTTKDIDQLLDILDTIDDELFKLNCCDTVDCELGIDTRRVLCYGAFMNVSVKDSNENKDNILLVKKMAFNDKVDRFDTFMQVYKKYDHSKWKYFVDCDLIEEVKILLQKGEPELASVIFSRLDRNTVYELSSIKIEEIIILLNKDILTGTIFLNTFVSISLKYIPDSLAVFVKWMDEKVFQLERQSAEFPDCAIKFVEKITKLIDLTTPTKKHFNIEDLNSATHLLKPLGDLKLLWSHFGIKLPLATYLSNPSTVIRTLLIENMNTSYFEDLLKNFVCPFIYKNNLDMDLVLTEQIENMFQYDEKYWVNSVSLLLKYITSIDKKLTLAYELLEVTDIPWSESVKDIARTICQLAPNDPLTEKIMVHMTDEHIFVILRKYKICKSQFERLDDKIFGFNRMLYLNPPTVLEDIHRLCTDNKVRQEADELIINKLILAHNFDKAMMILDESGPENIVILSKRFLNRCLFYATAYDVRSEKLRECYFTTLNPIWNRLKKHVTDAAEKNRLEFDYKTAYAIYGISKYFKMKVTCIDVINPKKINNLLCSLVQRTVDLCLKDDTSNFETFIITELTKLAHLFDTDLEEVFMICLATQKNSNLFLTLGQHILDISKCSKLLSRWALYLLKYLKTNFLEDCDETFSYVFSNVSKQDKDYLLGVELAKKLSIKAMMHASSDDHLDVIEVIRWIDTCFYITNVSRYSNIKALQIYPSRNALSQGIKTIQAVQSAFNMYCNILGSSTNPNNNYLKYFTTNVSVSEDEVYDEMKRLTPNIRTLIEDGQHLTCLNIVRALQTGFLCNFKMPADACIVFQSLIKTNWLPKTLEAVLSYRYIDKNLLFNLMLLLDSNQREEQLWKYLQVYKRHPHKLNVVTQVGIELCKCHKDFQGESDLKRIQNLCKWWNRVSDNHINYEFFFTAKREDHLEALILAKQLHLGNLNEYCFDFGLDLQKTYLKFLEMTLKCWTPKIRKIANNMGETNIVVQNNESELDGECQKIIKYITNTDSVLSLVDQLWPQTNYYYYEVFMVLLSIQSKFSVSKNITFNPYQPLLLFLKNYKRVSSPSRSEREQWFGTFPTEASMDPLSEFRLPLTSTFFSSDIWTIIKPEVNLDTYKDWFKIVLTLKQFLNINDICTYAINSALPTGENSSSTFSTWELHPKFDHIIEKVEECAKSITDLERATAAVYTLMSNMTLGADKIRMAELSYKYAKLYRQNASGDDVQKVYNKVKQRYFNYSAMHIIHKYALAKEEYLKLVAQPTLLISKLYEDPRISKIFSVNYDFPDINKAVDELCVLFGLNATKIRFGVLLELIKPDCTLDLDRGAENESLNRACYICGSTDMFRPLLKIGMNKDDLKSSMSVQANALKCLYYTSDPVTLETMSEMTLKDFVAYINKVSVMAKLEDLGLNVKTVCELDNLNKKKLLKKLAEIDKPLAIQCVASICKIYDLDDLKYWEFIIKNLHGYLEHIRFRCVRDFVKRGWNAVITKAFTEEPIRALRLLQTCPVIYALNIEDYIKICISNKRLEIAAILLQYTSTEKYEEYIKVILVRQSIFKDVAELKHEGILQTEEAIEILKSVDVRNKIT